MRFPLFLPPVNEVCEGYVFTGVCLSAGGVCMAGGHAWWWMACIVVGGGACMAGGMHGRG